MEGSLPLLVASAGGQLDIARTIVHRESQYVQAMAKYPPRKTERKRRTAGTMGPPNRLALLGLLLLWAHLGMVEGRANVGGIHNDPELAASFDSIINSDKYRKQLMGLAESAGYGSMPTNSEEVYGLFSGMIGDAQHKAQSIKTETDQKIEDRVKSLQDKNAKKNGGGAKDGSHTMMHKSGDLLGKLGSAAHSEGGVGGFRMAEQLSSGKGMSREMLNNVGVSRASGGQATEHAMAGVAVDAMTGDGAHVAVFDKKGHISHEIKALAGVPKMPHISGNEAFAIALEHTPSEPEYNNQFEGIKTGDRVAAKVELMRRAAAAVGGGDDDDINEDVNGGDGTGTPNDWRRDGQAAGGGDSDASVDIDEDHDAYLDHEVRKAKDKAILDKIPYAGKTALSNYELLKSTKMHAFGTVPGLNIGGNDGQMTPQAQIQQRALHAAIGKQHTKLLKEQEKKHTDLSSVQMLENLQVRLATFKDEHMDDVFTRMNGKVEKWRDQGIHDLRTSREKGDQLTHASQIRWKGTQMKHKLLKAQQLMKMRKEL